MARFGFGRFTSRAACLLVAAVVLSACGGARATPSSLLPTRTLPPRSEPPPTRAPTGAPTRAPTGVPTRAASFVPTATVRPGNAEAAATPLPAARRTSLALCDGSQYDLAAASPQPVTAPGQIVFMTLDGNIALTDASGSRVVSVTTDAFISESSSLARFYQYPTFSNDGTQLAFVGLNVDVAREAVTQTLYVAPAESQARRTEVYTATSGPIPYLDWAPDGKSLAFLTFDSEQQFGELRVANADGSTSTVIDSGQSVYWHWRADSGAVVARLGGRDSVSNTQAADRIAVFDAVSKSSGNLPVTPGEFKSPQFSPNGRFILFVAHVSGGDELVLADAKGNPVCAVTSIDNLAAFAWSPDGRRVAWIDTDTAFTSPAPLFVTDLDDGRQIQVHDRASAFFWSPEGERLAVYSLVVGKPPASLEASASPASASGSSPSDEDTALVRIEIVDAGAGDAVPVADTLPTGEFAQYLTYFDQYSRATTPWSPDGRELVFFSILREQQTVEVGVASLNSTNTAVSVKRVATGANAFWSPR